ncbi:homeobox Nkx- -like [Brachionus plicatilis]|uniref:Homeobox Nkx--like n=1 Tax=Brachionus plicatilis TaxID=10195 RepID=A0A3M7SB41_BRAPC|nr:homeobox Nkx- -like [Brachionus plicatilis]
MNSLNDSSDLMNSSSRQDFLRLPPLNSSFTFGNCDLVSDPFSHSFNYSNQFPQNYSVPNDNFIGIFNTNDSNKYSIKASSYMNGSNLPESNIYSYGANNLSPFLNKASNFSSDPTNSENLFRLNFLQFDSNFKHYSNLLPPNNTQIECRAQSLPQNGQLCNQVNSNNQPYQNVSQDKSRKPKKSRILFSQWQINELEKLFKKQRYVTSNERDLMAKRLKLQANQVKIWFQNRRYKIKKQNESQKE